VIIQYGKPFAFERTSDTTRGQQQAAADEILRRITVMYNELTSSRAKK